MICFGVCALAAAGTCLAVTQSNAPAVTKVEPPSWWANQSVNPVRLLVRGANLKGARVVASKPQTTVADVKVNANGTYLFVSVRISPSAQPGDYPLRVATRDGTVTIPFQINASLNRMM
jgi:hypothetical protein